MISFVGIMLNASIPLFHQHLVFIVYIYIYIYNSKSYLKEEDIGDMKSLEIPSG